MLTKPLKVKTKTKEFVVTYNGSPFIKVTRGILNDFLGDLSKDADFQFKLEKRVTKKKRKKKEVVVDKKKVTKAIQLSKQYASQWKKWYKKKVKRVVSPNSDDFKHFEKAVEIIIRNDTTIKVFLKAQISGLRFINSGQGTFPRLSHLSTDGAENRLLEYIKTQEMENVELTESERRMELMENKKYKKFHKRIKNGDATLLEALYVKECQYARRGEVQKMVTGYIKMTKKKV